jgi:hypothetical protein
MRVDCLGDRGALAAKLGVLFGLAWLMWVSPAEGGGGGVLGIVTRPIWYVWGWWRCLAGQRVVIGGVMR